jgi:LTXXQ motif family protein
MTTFKSAAMLVALAFAALVSSGPIAAQPTPQERGPSMMQQRGSGQTQAQMPNGMMGMMGLGVMGMMGQGGMMPMMGMGEHVEGRIAFLRTELKIADAQLPQWNAFADALRANATRMSEMRNTMMQGGQGGTSLSASAKLDQMERMMTGMLDAVKATKAALGPLYAVLSDDQKKMADQLIQGPM